MQSLRLLSKLMSQGKIFFRKEAGAVILIYALALVPIIGFIGLSIDLGQIYYAHSIISGAVDAAAIAGAKAGGNAANMQQQATAIFNANIPPNFIGTISGPNVTISSNNQTVVVSASAKVNTSFLKLFGQNTLSAGATAQTQATSTGAEVVLALDNTGSMAGTPMQGEISAAKLLVNTIYGGAGNDTINGLWVAVVPYSTTVNINTPGLNPTTWLTTKGQAQVQNTNLYPNIAPTSTSVGGKWMGCIEARTPNSNTTLGYTNYASGMDSTDTPPTSNSTKFTPFLYPSTMAHQYVFGKPLNRGTTSSSTSALSTSTNPPWGNTGSTDGDNDWKLNGTVPSGSGLRFGDNYALGGGDGNMGVGPNLGCPIPMLPLTASQTTVLSTINNMKATFRGGTMINVGLAGAWWMISPNWRGLWPIDSTLPQDYEKTLKIVVLMTDGQNQWYDWPGGVPGDPDSSHNYAADADYTGYGRLAEGRIGTTNFNNTIPVLNASMANMCATLKNNGVVIYTIIFNHDGSAGDASTQALFQSCATDTSKYFITFSNQDLINAFQNIGQSITKLRLTWPGKP
ncbi:MAG: hypothetical protein K2P93_08790 [Alphaproteobacteria bacterium]|nr:hypothetical protein [Alphaproteobacteria bacterium]